MLTATRRIAASVLALTMALPAAAADSKAPAQASKAAPDLKPAPDLKSAPPSKPARASKPAQASKPAPAAAANTAPEQPAAAVLDAPARASEPFIRGHRYAYVAGGVLLLGGVGFGYFSRGEAKRAESLESAREARSALERSRAAAATANVMYGVAGLTLAYGLLLEFLPEPAAEAASLTYHF